MPDCDIDEKMQARGEGRMTLRRYYDGKHATQLTDRQRKYLQVATGQEFNDNYCPVVVDALSERMSVTGFSVSAESEGAALKVQETAWQWWKVNRMDQTQGDTHTAAIRDGDAYVLVEYDNDLQRPVIQFEPAFDGEFGFEVHYHHKRGKPAYASKTWAEGDIKRRNLYYPERIEKYCMRGEGGAWEMYRDDGEAWPLPWVDSAGRPLGIPGVHFRNRGQGYNYGTSELQDAVPLQNALNKAIIDLVAAADTTAFRIYWMVGDDPSGLEIVPGSWIYTSKGPSEAAIGHIPGEDLSKLIEFKDAFAMEVARVTRTPLSYFQLTRQVASGESLKQQESGLVSRAKNRQVAFGNSWEDVMLLCVKLHNAFSPEPELDETVGIETQWRDPETRDDKTHLEELMIKAGLGIPFETLWAEMGYSADQIATMKDGDEYKLIQVKRLLEVAKLANDAGYGVEPFLRSVGWNDEQIGSLYLNLPEQ